ncbi:hypothetical protein NHQ30_008519 [Ciborinia camelliae]|nr:hypothetical protein NHQ30_008519 [Ciborinia camelliae]
MLEDVLNIQRRAGIKQRGDNRVLDLHDGRKKMKLLRRGHIVLARYNTEGFNCNEELDEALRHHGNQLEGSTICIDMICLNQDDTTKRKLRSSLDDSEPVVKKLHAGQQDSSGSTKLHFVRSYQNPAFRQKNGIWINLCAACGQIISSYILSKYIVRTSLSMMKDTILHYDFTGFPILECPSSTTFIFAILVYGISAMSMYRANAHHAHQQQILRLGIIGVIDLGLHLYRNKCLGVVVAFMPAGITMALVISMIFHFWLPNYEEVVFRGFIKQVEKAAGGEGDGFAPVESLN